VRRPSGISNRFHKQQGEVCLQTNSSLTYELCGAQFGYFHSTDYYFRLKCNGETMSFGKHHSLHESIGLISKKLSGINNFRKLYCGRKSSQASRIEHFAFPHDFICIMNPTSIADRTFQRNEQDTDTPGIRQFLVTLFQTSELKKNK
jgi:hypothetical protein